MTTTPEQDTLDRQAARNERAIALLRSWIEEGGEADSDLEEQKREFEENRTSYRPLRPTPAAK